MIDLRNPSIIKEIQGAFNSDNLAMPYATFDTAQLQIIPKYLYDTWDVPDEEADKVLQTNFFKNVTGSMRNGATVHRYETNLSDNAGAQLSKIYAFDSIGLVVLTETAHPFDDANFATAMDILRRAVLVIKKEKREFLEVPVWKIITLDAPQPSSADGLFAPLLPSFGQPLFIQPGIQWDCFIEYPVEGFYFTAEQVKAIKLQLILHGVEIRPASSN